jgi:hypothetical protein
MIRSLRRIVPLAAPVLSLLLATSPALAAGKVSGTVQPLARVLLANTLDGASINADVDLGAAALTIPNSADALFNKRATLAASANVDHDLSGTLVDPLGGTVVFAKVYAIAIYAESTNVNNVVLGGAAANAFLGPFADATDKVVITPKGSVLLLNPLGWTVTAGTGDLLRVANGGAGSSVGYRLLVIGSTT